MGVESFVAFTRAMNLTSFAGWGLRVPGKGQIIATSQDLTPNGGLVREIPLFQANPVGEIL